MHFYTCVHLNMFFFLNKTLNVRSLTKKETPDIKAKILR